MRIIGFLTLLFLLSSCAKVQTSPIVPPDVASPTPYSTPTPETSSDLKTTLVSIVLTPKQKSYLDESLPGDVREVLEKSEKFEVFAEVNKDETSETDSRTFNPNRFVYITTEARKKEILEAFYLDAASEDSPAVCYEPHHSLRATYAGRTVEIEICFDCSRFVVKGLGSKAWGTIVREKRRSESLLVHLVEAEGKEIVK